MSFVYSEIVRNRTLFFLNAATFRNKITAQKSSLLWRRVLSVTMYWMLDTVNRKGVWGGGMGDPIYGFNLRISTRFVCSRNIHSSLDKLNEQILSGENNLSWLVSKGCIVHRKLVYNGTIAIECKFLKCVINYLLLRAGYALNCKLLKLNIGLANPLGHKYVCISFKTFSYKS